MAAVLCNSIADLCLGIRTGIDALICTPCGRVCERIGDALSAPFAFYIAVAVGFNVPQIVSALTQRKRSNFADSYGDGGGNTEQEDACLGPRHWLAVNAVFCAVNVAAALYLAIVIGGRRAGGMPDGSNDGSILKRVKDVLCYDPFVAVYIVVGIAYLVWHAIGVTRLVFGGCDDEDTESRLKMSLACNWAYIFLGGAAFTCSVCCAGAMGSKGSYQPIVGEAQGGAGGPKVY